MAKGIANRNTAKYNLEQQYIVLFDSRFNLSWNLSFIKRFQDLWSDGLNEDELAEKIGCQLAELTMIVISLTEQEKIERRQKGFLAKLQASI